MASPPSTAAATLVEEPPAPDRSRRPLDALRLGGELMVAVLVVAVAAAAQRTSLGLGRDLVDLGEAVPAWLLELLAVGSSLVGLLVPPALVVHLLLHRQPRRATEVLAAGLLGMAAAVATTVWLQVGASATMSGAFTPPGVSISQTTPVPGFVSFVVATVTAAGLRSRPRLRRLVALAVVGGLVAGVLDQATAVAGAVLAIALGRVCGLAVRLLSGVPSSRPDAATVAATLAAHGLPVSTMAWALPAADGARRYAADGPAGPLDLVVLDRDREGAGMLTRTYRWLRTRGEVLPGEPLTLRAGVEAHALLARAVAASGARTPRLLRALPVGPDAAVLAYERRALVPLRAPGPPGGPAPAAAVDPVLLADLWSQLSRLREHRVAHRRLSAATVAVDERRRVWLLDTVGGKVAAPDLALRLDIAQLLVEAALVAGPAAAVDSAVTALGRDAVAGATPLLQPLALARSTRQALRDRRELLTELRDQIIERAGPPEAAEVRLERVRIRSLVTGVAGLVALYLAGSQLTGVDLLGVARSTDLGWAAAALAATALTYLGSALSLLGFVPERVPLGRAVAAQLALSFVKLVAPTAVSNVALNLRLLVRCGIDRASAAASVAAAQVVAVAITVPLLLVLGVLTGRRAAAGLAPSPPAMIVAGGVLVGLLLTLLAPPVRTRARAAWQAFTGRALPRILDVVQHPAKLAQGIGGNLLITVGFTAALAASLLAVGGEAPLAVLAVVFLAGNTVGTAVPTPGGLGAVEAALTAGLTTAGVPAAQALPAVLLFRLATFWLPILPGWLAWTRLERAGAL